MATSDKEVEKEKSALVVHYILQMQNESFVLHIETNEQTIW